MVGEAAAGLFKKEVHIARRDAKQCRDRGRIKALIAAAAFDLPQNRGAPRRADTTLLRKPTRLAPKRKCRELDEMIAEESRGSVPFQIFRNSLCQISK